MSRRDATTGAGSRSADRSEPPPSDQPSRDQAPAGGITVGVVGRPVRATVSPWGDVTPWATGAPSSAGDPPTLAWYVAADDRWHEPRAEVTVRQRRVGGTAVVETRLRVPDGDAVQRVWSVADGGGLTVIEVANDSPLAFAVAFAGAPVLTSRRPADVPVRGIDLPGDAVVMPVGHRSSVRVGLAVDAVSGALRSGELGPVAGADAVERGWLATTGRASRLELPDPTLVDSVVAARCDLLLDGPVDAGDDPGGFLLDVAELVRLGDDADAWLPEVVAPAESVARQNGADVAAALRSALRVARAAGDRRAAGDLDRLIERRGDRSPAPGRPFAEIERGRCAGRFVHDVETLLVAGGELLPTGFPTQWLGHDFAVHGVPTGPGGSVSFAIRWHGERPAVLWEQQGEPVVLCAPVVGPGWSTSARSGEALWAPVVRRPRSALRVTSL